MLPSKLTEKYRKIYYLVPGYSVEKAYKIMNKFIIGEADASMVSYLRYDVLEDISNSASKVCLLRDLLPHRDKYFDALCFLGREWSWKFHSGAGGSVPDSTALMKFIELTRGIFSKSLPRDQEISELLQTFTITKRQPRQLYNVGPVVFTHWLSLAKPRDYIPFDDYACTYFKDKKECRHSMNSTSSKFSLYYIELLNAIHGVIYDTGIKFDHDRTSKGAVRDLIELYATLYIVDRI